MMNFFRQPPLLLATMTLAVFTLFSCRKNAEDALALLSETEAAEIVESSVSERSAGTAMPTVEMAQLLEGYLQNCGVPGDTTLQRSNTLGPVTCNATFDLGWLINCNALGVPQDAQVSVAGNSTFSTQRWAGADVTAGVLTFAGLQPQATAYVVNGSYTLEGDLTGSLRNADPTLSVTTTLALAGLEIRKSDYAIAGGSGTLAMVATNGRGRTETLDGAIVFNSDGTATVTVNGHTHTFPL